MKAVPIALLSVLCLAPLAASAQWQWLDQDGHKVFSDQPPPPNVPPNRILKQPGARNDAAPTQTAAAPAAAPSTPKGVDPALKPAGKDKALEERRKQAEAAEAEKKKAEEAKYAALRVDNCKRARSSKASLESGQRIATMNDKGEREYMDDTRRAAEIKRADEIIARDCRADRQ
jgi:hypothetical protein